ncbi:leucine-rich repeat protein SHOC-2 [Anoplophora glabripennis]|nr:leucine-rich repeat protein SHOC-2 [Anoplophora glabripennis]
MLNYVVLVFVLSNFVSGSSGLWDQDNNCPLICTCRLQHLTESAIYRFMQKDKNVPMPGEIGSVENNEVVYEENLDTMEMLDEHQSTIVRSAICILQTETEPIQVLENLPSNIETLTLIQGYESGNKTIKFSYLNKFPQLLSLELVGPHMVNKPVNSHLICEIDLPLPNLKYLNLERILIRNSKQQEENFLKEFKEEDLTFEYVQKLDRHFHPLTMVQKGTVDDNVVPYKVFKEQKETDGDVPLFIGFKKLFLLRITNCELNNVHWEMFDGLRDLQYLILERNNLRFIPAFAFYGTPNLKTLSLAHNKLLDIQITDLAGLLELEYLDLSFNNFTQLSELSLPPFPKLKLANFGNNPISIIFPNTFEVMNTTDSLIIGSDDIPLTLITNSFIGLNMLQKLTLNNLELEILKRDLFMGMPSLTELILSGNITKIEYDAFLEVNQIGKLILSNCQITNMSMDAFIGLQKLHYLDLSKNKLEYLPPGIFDNLISIKELYLNGNNLKQVSRDIFSKIHPKLLRLSDNPWHCSCDMSEWKPMIVNKVKQRSFKPCEYTGDKGIGCTAKNRFDYKYVFDNKVAPRCAEPRQFVNWSVFHAMRRILRCPDYKPKFRKHTTLGHSNEVSTQIYTTEAPKSIKFEKLQLKLKKGIFIPPKVESNIKPMSDVHENQINSLSPMNNHQPFVRNFENGKKPRKIRRRLRKGSRRLVQKNEEISNSINTNSIF